MDNKQLYYITIENTEDPLLLGGEDIVLIYDDNKKATLVAEKLKQKYVNISLNARLIKDNALFFSKMASCDINKYLLNGNGRILGPSDFGCTELIKIEDGGLDLYEEIESMQPRTKTISSS